MKKKRIERKEKKIERVQSTYLNLLPLFQLKVKIHTHKQRKPNVTIRKIHKKKRKCILAKRTKVHTYTPK